MRKKTLAYALLCLLLASFLGVQFVEVAKGNPMFYPINVHLVTPRNGDAFSSTSVPVKFTFSIPKEDNEISYDSLPHSYYYWFDGNWNISYMFVPTPHDSVFDGVVLVPTGIHQLTIRVAAARDGELIHYFGDASVSIKVNPSPNPTITALPTQKPTNSPTLLPSLTEATLPSPTPSPSIPEFPLTILAITFLTITILVEVFFRRKQLRDRWS